MYHSLPHPGGDRAMSEANLDLVVRARYAVVSAYDGRRLAGVVRRTWLRGRLTGGEPAGRLIRRTES
jgi:hypothetical protein